ncbi:TPA: hypothetical protein ACS7ZY_003347 [Providencia alcalifaciens]
MDNRKKYPFTTANSHTTQLAALALRYEHLQLGIYQGRGRVAKIHTGSFYLDGLKSSPLHTRTGQATFDLMNWLLDKPRLAGEERQSFLLSTLDKEDFSGFDFHPQQSLWVDSFHSPHQWRDGEPRSQAQLADALLPSGQWYRHYDTVILACDANDQQVDIIRHWLELTGGSIIIIEDDDTSVSLPVQQLLSELDNIEMGNLPKAIQPIPKSSGMQVTAYQSTSNGIEKNAFTIPNLTHYASELPESSAFTVWVYEGVITVPKSDNIRIYLDTLYHGESLTFEVNQQTREVTQNDEFAEIIIQKSKAGQQIPFKITTTTQGKPPEIRLGWGFPNSGEIQFIPDDAMHHRQITAPDAPLVPQRPTATAFNPYGFQQRISLPATAINSLALTEETLQNSRYFSMIINRSRQTTALRLDDIALSRQDSWEALAAEIEFHVNQQLAELELPSISVKYENRQLIIDCNGMQISQFQLKDQQLHSILVAENPNGLENQFVVGAITGKLPHHEEIDYFQLIEAPLFGQVELNQRTGKWQYQPDSSQVFNGHDQFDVIAVMKNGAISAPMSIQLQAEDTPQLSIPGERTFSLPDPIYHQPQRRHQPVPNDMQVHGIQLAQTHLLPPDAPYFGLTANRWALLKVEITSQTGRNAPDIVAIIRDKQNNELERIVLTGPEKLPTSLEDTPTTMSIDAQHLHHQSYTAPIKGKWVQPDMQIQIMAGNQPLIQPYTNAEGIFSPTVKSVTPMISHVTHKSLYRHGHGIYSYSPLSWGLEAAAKLPTHQFTLFSYPTLTQQTGLYPYIVKDERGYVDNSTLIHPFYDSPSTITEPSKSQIKWAYFDSQKAARRTKLYSEFFYSSIERLPMEGGTSNTIGLASHNFGGGITKPSILWHEVFGHGLSLGHTTSQHYPYSSESHGDNIAFDQYRQQYTTYRKPNPDDEIIPAMYPADYPHYTNQYDAFLAHSDYLTQQAQNFLANIDESKIEREYRPVYQLTGIFLPLSDGTLHPYSHLTVTQTIGHLIQKDHSNSRHSLTLTYATPSGLLTENLKIALRDNELNLNIANKGELVSLELIKTENGADTTVYHYKNPESLANRLFIHGDGKTVPEKLQMDNYWRGGKLFWSVSEDNRALSAKWVENGQLRQQYFSLAEPFNRHPVDTTTKFTPLNHLDLIEDSPQQPVSNFSVLSEVQLLSDVQISQQIPIGELGTSIHTYWATISTLDEHGKIHESAPLEAWYLSAQDGMLTVKGTIDSTPNLKIAGVNIYFDQHLQDNMAPHRIFIQQNTQGTLAENREFLHYDRPVEFNTLISQMAGMREEQLSPSYSPVQQEIMECIVPLAA